MDTPTEDTHPIFAVNERCLCYHGPLIYEAKVLKATDYDGNTSTTGHVGLHYFVHYKGWKQTWDEWVPGLRLLKFNETNIATQKSLQAQAHAAHAAANPSGSKKSTRHNVFALFRLLDLASYYMQQRTFLPHLLAQTQVQVEGTRGPQEGKTEGEVGKGGGTR